MVGSNGAGTLTGARPGVAVRAGAPVPVSPAGAPRRRRWGVTVVGAGAVVVGGWAFAGLWMAAGDRVEVVALANDVGAYERLDRSDLASVRVAEAEGVAVVGADRIDDVVGRTARADLPAESLLVDADLFAEDEALVGAGEAVVGAVLPEGTVPVELARGRRVMVVLRPATVAGSGASGVESVDAWVLKVEESEGGAGREPGVVVSVVVPRSDASRVAAAGADGRLSLVALEE